MPETPEEKLAKKIKEIQQKSMEKTIEEQAKSHGLGYINLHGFPIVLGPKEALGAFGNSGLEYMTLENYLISKKPI